MSSSTTLRLVLALVGILFYAGVLWENCWSTVDDGNDLARMVNYSQRLQNGTLTVGFAASLWADSGIFRPCFVFLRLAEYKLFGTNCFLHHAAHLLVMLAVCQLLFSLTQRVTLSTHAAWFTGALFVLFSPNAENWFKLGDPGFYPQAFVVVSLWCVVRSFEFSANRPVSRAALLAAAVALLVPVYFTKETSVGMLGMPVGILLACWAGAGTLLAHRNLPLALAYLAGHLSMAVAWFVLKNLSGVRVIASGAYSQDYRLSADVLIATAFKYADVLWNGFQLLVPIALALWARQVWLWWRGRRNLDAWDGWALIGLCWIGSTIGIMLPWTHPLGRYLIGGVAGLAIFVASTLWRFWNESGLKKAPVRLWWETGLRWVLIANLALLPLISFCRSYNYVLFRHDFDQAASAVIRTIAQQAPPSSRLFMNMPADSYSIFNEMTKLLDVLFGRADLRQYNYNHPTRPEPQPGDYLITFARDPANRSMEVFVPETFHDTTLQRLQGRLKLVRHVRLERKIPQSYPDAPIFNAFARLGVKLPDYLGNSSKEPRSLFAWQHTFVDWKIYQFLP